MCVCVCVCVCVCEFISGTDSSSGQRTSQFKYVPYCSTTILWFAIFFLFIYALYDPTFSTVHT